MAPVSLHGKVAAKCWTARSLTHVRHTIPKTHTSQPDPHGKFSHYDCEFVYNAERLDPSICARVREICVRMSSVVFHVWAIGAFWASLKKLFFFFVQNMRHEVLFSNQHRSRTLLSKAKQHQRCPMRRGAVPSEPDHWFGTVARSLRRMTHLVQHFSAPF